MEPLDGRLVPDGNPAAPPTDPPPAQVGEPAAQVTNVIWGYEIGDNGTAAFGLYEATTTGLPASATAFTSVYNPATGEITAATPFSGTTAPIGLPSNPQNGSIYTYDPAAGTWAGVSASDPGTFISPSAGNTVTPITNGAGAIVCWAVHPETTTVLGAGALVSYAAPAAAPAAPLATINLGPGSTIRLPDGTVLTFPNGGTVTVNPNGGNMTIEGQGGTVTTPGGATGAIPPGGLQVPIQANSGTITLPGNIVIPLSQASPPPPPLRPVRPLPPSIDGLFPPNTIRPITKRPIDILTDPPFGW